MTKSEQAIIVAARAMVKWWLRNYHQGVLIFGTPEYILWLAVTTDRRAKRKGRK